MSVGWVIKLPVADSKSAILVHVVSASSSDELDITLLATDGDAAFRGKGTCPVTVILAMKQLMSDSEVPKFGQASRKELQWVH
jgi:hypothetical protein